MPDNTTIPKGRRATSYELNIVRRCKAGIARLAMSSVSWVGSDDANSDLDGDMGRRSRVQISGRTSRVAKRLQSISSMSKEDPNGPREECPSQLPTRPGSSRRKGRSDSSERTQTRTRPLVSFRATPIGPPTRSTRVRPSAAPAFPAVQRVKRH